MFCPGGMTHCAATFKYMDPGVRNSEERGVQTGTRFGGFAPLTAEARTCCIASSEG